MVLVGSCSLPGNRYGSLNQDYVVVEELHSAKDLKKHQWTHQLYIALVMDGHGMLGEVAARDAGNAILAHIKSSELLKRKQLSEIPQEEMRQLMEEAFTVGHQCAMRLHISAPHSYDFPKGSKSEQNYSLTTHVNGDKVYSNALLGNRILEFGTTAALACLQDTSLVVANVGDTLAVLGKDVDDSYDAEEVSVRHYGWNPDEAARLKEGYGDKVSISPEDGYLTVEEGRLRGFQLAMTRALGHKLLAEYGVSEKPSVTFRRVQEQDVCLIVASDGLWEVMSEAEAVRTVCDAIAEGQTVQEAARLLCSEAVRLAVNCQRGGEADNTTAAVFLFDEL